MTPENFDIDALIASLPPAFKEKVASMGGHRLVAARHGIDLENGRAALEKIGYLLFKDAVPVHSLQDSIRSLALVTEGK